MLRKIFEKDAKGLQRICGAALKQLKTQCSIKVFYEELLEKMANLGTILSG